MGHLNRALETPHLLQAWIRGCETRIGEKIQYHDGEVYGGSARVPEALDEN